MSHSVSLARTGASYSRKHISRKPLLKGWALMKSLFIFFFFFWPIMIVIATKIPWMDPSNLKIILTTTELPSHLLIITQVFVSIWMSGKKLRSYKFFHVYLTEINQYIRTSFSPRGSQFRSENSKIVTKAWTVLLWQAKQISNCLTTRVLLINL